MPADGTLDLREKLQKQPYSLSPEDFDTLPTEITPYNNGDRITRQNFIPFLINSFGFSLGSMDSQVEFLIWKQLQDGFDWNQSLDNLGVSDEGNAKKLSNAETEMIYQAYARVERHDTVDPKDNNPKAILGHFFTQLSYINQPLADGRHIRIKMPLEDFRKLTFEQLSQRSKVRWMNKRGINPIRR